jgi:hypothetical protein
LIGNSTVFTAERFNIEDFKPGGLHEMNAVAVSKLTNLSVFASKRK